MKRLALFLLSAFAAVAASAASPAVKNIAVTLDLKADGSAVVTEVWDVTVTSGTEWYIVKENLGQIRIYDLAVTDENGRAFTNIGAWDIHRSIQQKAYQCGIVQKDDGCELCWGVGSYGDHCFTATYTMTNVVEGYSDYDALHLQLVSPELSSSPQHVDVTVRSETTPFSTINTRLWGFGFPGTAEFRDGELVMESSKPLGRKNSVIILLRLNKGIYSPSVNHSEEFATHLEQAMEGAAYEDDEKEPSRWERFLSILMMLVTTVGWILFPLLALIGSHIHNRKKVLGCKMAEVGWCRDIPFGGNILEADYVLGQLGEDKQKNSIAGAMILRMIWHGNLLVGKDAKDRIEISFNDSKNQDRFSESEKELYQMMKEASGADSILQYNEFSKWSSKHTSRVNDWVTKVKSEGKAELGANGYLRASKFTESGQAEARKVVGFKKYLDDFTIIGERASQEVALWNDYLVFASLYGIADKVAKELKDINPQAFEQMMVYDYPTMNDVVRMTRSMGNSITNARAQNFSGGSFSPSRGGFGGFTSIGGGGGFSGGGFGGGSR